MVGLEALAREKFDIRAIFSHLDDPDEKIWFGSVVEWAKRNEIPVFCPKNVNTPEWIEMIRGISPEVILLPKPFEQRYLDDSIRRFL
jgi:UDP-4-amino-4-deoxy-L-arabinose formyltransferase/UDP-glucuronic acid dehydrogenase (UDP-4-keto-hexauronic acid decarboxylating)